LGAPPEPISQRKGASAGHAGGQTGLLGHSLGTGTDSGLNPSGLKTDDTDDLAQNPLGKKELKV